MGFMSCNSFNDIGLVIFVNLAKYCQKKTDWLFRMLIFFLLDSLWACFERKINLVFTLLTRNRVALSIVFASFWSIAFTVVVIFLFIFASSFEVKEFLHPHFLGHLELL